MVSVPKLSQDKSQHVGGPRYIPRVARPDALMDDEHSSSQSGNLLRERWGKRLHVTRAMHFCAWRQSTNWGTSVR